MTMIVFCGYANNDVTVRVPRIPHAGERVQATAVEQVDGGMNANAAVSAARMGATVMFAGAVGADARSGEFLVGLEREGVDTSWAPRDAFLSTAIVMVTPDGDRAIISQDDANDAGRIAVVLRRVADSGGGWVYLDGYRAAFLPCVVDKRVELMIDLDGCEDRTAALRAFALAEHVVVGRGLWEGRFGIAPHAWPDLAAEHRTCLLVTDGARGWTLVTPDREVLDEPAVPVEVVDAIGAGDCFGGTYIAFVDAGHAPAEAARLAGAAAALACTTAGPRACPSLHELTRSTDSPTILEPQEIP